MLFAAKEDSHPKFALLVGGKLSDRLSKIKADIFNLELSECPTECHKE
ncbi:MAG: hypothetical protein IGS49_24945 [Chlorogloeopsis fritschii C42_A2020_084]|nr:hypothetical protein [Chlorogloeopsis fritschii]MBF2008602.1 hypothetical protein [Chlorogloeopsis fritschii C42_A2020_084]